MPSRVQADSTRESCFVRLRDLQNFYGLHGLGLAQLSLFTEKFYFGESTREPNYHRS